MSVENSKFSLTIVIPLANEYRLFSTLTLMGDLISVNTVKNIPDITIDRSWICRQHVQDVNAGGRSRLNAMKALSLTRLGTQEFSTE